MSWMIVRWVGCHWSQEFDTNIFDSNDNDSVRKQDDSTLCVIDANYLINIFVHSNVNDCVTEPYNSTWCVIEANYLTQNIFHSNDNDSVKNPYDSTSEDRPTVERFRDHLHTTRSNSS